MVNRAGILTDPRKAAQAQTLTKPTLPLSRFSLFSFRAARTPENPIFAPLPASFLSPLCPTTGWLTALLTTVFRGILRRKSIRTTISPASICFDFQDSQQPPLPIFVKTLSSFSHENPRPRVRPLHGPPYSSLFEILREASNVFHAGGNPICLRTATGKDMITA